MCRCLLSTPPLAVIVALALAGCDVANVRPEPEVRTNTVTVNVPVPVPCFKESDRPVMPPPTPVNVDTASTEQLAAAELADAINLQVYTDAVDALFVACQSKGLTK